MKKTFLLAILSLLGMTQAVAQSETYLPLVREGVQWVNEKVIINHGDTTRYYYKYEFCGLDSFFLYEPQEDYFDPTLIDTILIGGVNNACYYYTGDVLDVERDSLIAGLKNNRRKVTGVRNNAYLQALLDNRLLFKVDMAPDGGTQLFYDFLDPLYYYLMMDIDWHKLFGGEPFMKLENIRELDPIEIEGLECMRSAYLNDQGDTLCYVVEGIGFDSYNMGDLLTPFMIPPDPNADYQEYCGLSHVVKDGKIIYKGMRYREDIETGIKEVETDKRQAVDGNYYNLMGQPVGKQVPQTPGIYIHNGKKICVGQMQ